MLKRRKESSWGEIPFVAVDDRSIDEESQFCNGGAGKRKDHKRAAQHHAK